MEPAVFDGDVLLVARPGGELARGSLVVAWPPTVRRGVGSAQLKRVVGLPGEVVEFDEGSLLINGEAYPEPYLGGLPSSLGLSEMSWLLGVGEYLVLGDRRFRSTDSRDFGPVNARQIVGKAWLRLWPPKKVGRLNG